MAALIETPMEITPTAAPATMETGVSSPLPAAEDPYKVYPHELVEGPKLPKFEGYTTLVTLHGKEAPALADLIVAARKGKGTSVRSFGEGGVPLLPTGTQKRTDRSWDPVVLDNPPADLTAGKEVVVLPLDEQAYGLQCCATQLHKRTKDEVPPMGAKPLKWKLKDGTEEKGYRQTRVTKGLARFLELRGTSDLVLIINRDASTEKYNFYGEQVYGTLVSVATKDVEEHHTDAYESFYKQGKKESLEDFAAKIMREDFGV